MKPAPPLLLLLLATPARADDPRVVPDVVYGHKDGMALTYDVIRPAKPSGAAALRIRAGWACSA